MKNPHKYWDVNNLYGRAMSQKLPVGSFDWVEKTSQFNKKFTKGYNNDSDVRYFFKVDVQYPKELHKLHNGLPFLHERIKIGNLQRACMIEKYRKHICKT